MNIFKKKNLVNNYKAELKLLQGMKDEGTARVGTDTWNFIGELDNHGITIDIDVVINHVKDIIVRLEKATTDEEVEFFNY